MKITEEAINLYETQTHDTTSPINKSHVSVTSCKLNQINTFVNPSNEYTY